MFRKALLISFLAFFLLSSFSESQTRLFPISLGPFISMKGCVNSVEPPQGFKNDFLFADMPDFGLSFYYPFGSEQNFGLTADISYLTVRYKLKLYANPNINAKLKYNYFTFGVGTYLSSFILSFNLAVPLGAKVDGSILVPMGVYYPLNDDDLATVFFLRLGGAIPLVADDNGRLNLLVYGDYFLTGHSKNDSEFNPKVASLSLGISYMFNLIK